MDAIHDLLMADAMLHQLADRPHTLLRLKRRQARDRRAEIVVLVRYMRRTIGAIEALTKMVAEHGR